jgi:hypothetical protein
VTIFSRFVDVDLPSSLECGANGRNPAFEVTFAADGDVPFAQVIVHDHGRAHLVTGDAVRALAGPDDGQTRVATVPAGLVGPGEYTVQVEGCRVGDLPQAGGGDWVKEFRTLTVTSAPRADQGLRVTREDPNAVKVYFGIHKHMHQPYYDTTDLEHWDGEKDDIFGSRSGAYTEYIPAAVQQYVAGGLPHAGLSTSWSGSLIEQLDRCAARGWCGGRFAGWSDALRAMARQTTSLGNPRVDFVAFGFYHPLMALIPERDAVRQIEWHRRIVEQAFGVQASTVMFPPETAFHVRMIPALKRAGVEAVIYDSIHRFRACQDYPYAGTDEGMLPPSPADQVNPAVDDWLQLHNVWAGSKISPSLLRPEYVGYTDPDGVTHTIIAVPAERYIGNEDARGGFGALQYPSVLGQVHRHVVDTGTFDPRHPPFFLLHSDGDNYGGGADSYYKHNTARLVEWLQQDPRFELTTVRDYLDRFPPDPARVAHLEPGSWSGADNGDPQFMKWFSRYHEPYSPDLNSWAVLTAFQNCVHTLEDLAPDDPALSDATRLLLTAETSCYWYWTGQHGWDQQVTNAADAGYHGLRSALDAVTAGGRDRTGPTVFAPWLTPENPGGLRWGQGGLIDAPREGTVHTFVFDLSGLARVDLVLHAEGCRTVLPMRSHGSYPCQTGAELTADYFTAALPVGAGDVRYVVEAEDCRGNVTRSALERAFLA